MTDTPPADIRALLGDAQPAADDLIVSLAQSVHARRVHDHPTGHEDWFCSNRAGWAGDRMAVVLRRLLDAEVEADRLRAELATARAAAFSEAAALISSTSLARLEEIDEADQRPSHWERHGEWCEAAALLLAARTGPDAR